MKPTVDGKMANPKRIKQWIRSALNKFKNKKQDMALTISGSTGGAGGSISSSTIVGTGGTYSVNYPVYAATGAQWGMYQGTVMSSQTSTSVLTLHSKNYTELVRIENDGTVKWKDDATVDAAAESFAKTLQLGAEKAAGITYGVKQRMRDTVFEEIISMSKEKGSLTPEDLTYLWQAAKIMDKLKGI
jgi:hypothetical protein